MKLTGLAFKRKEPSRLERDIGRLSALDDQGDALADANAHRAERLVRLASSQLVGGARDEAGAAHA